MERGIFLGESAEKNGHLAIAETVIAISFLGKAPKKELTVTKSVTVSGPFVSALSPKQISERTGNRYAVREISLSALSALCGKISFSARWRYGRTIRNNPS